MSLKEKWPHIKEKIKSNWIKVDETCPTCNQVTKVARGINRQNIRRLVLGKPSMQDWMIFFMIVMVLLISWRYNVEVAQARAMVDDPYGFCNSILTINTAKESNTQALPSTDWSLYNNLTSEDKIQDNSNKTNG